MKQPATRGADAMITHEHHWRTRSRHVTSDGDLSYQHCCCGQWRLLLGSDHVLATPNHRVDGRCPGPSLPPPAS